MRVKSYRPSVLYSYLYSSLTITFLFLPLYSFFPFSDHIGLNPLRIPEIRGDYLKRLTEEGIHHGARHRRLQKDENNAFPHIYDSLNFVGSTDEGFVDFKYESIASNTSINIDDYLNLASLATFTCEAFDTTFTTKTDSKPFWEEGVLIRNNVVMTISLDHAHATNHLSDISHFEERLVVHRAGLVFGLDFLSIHKDFDRNTNCLEQVPFSSPYFTIKTVSTTRLDTDESVTWKLHLEPATPFLIFKQFVMNLQHDPDAEREVKRRKEKNENVGIDVRSPERRLSGRMLPIVFNKDMAWEMNYDAGTKKAKKATYELFPTAGSATCTDCYAYASGKLVANLKFCIDIFVIGVTANTNYRYDTSTSDFNKGGVLLKDLPDCVAMSTIGASVESTSEALLSGKKGDVTPSNKALMAGLEAEAYIEGALGMNFKFSSNGVAAKLDKADVEIMADSTLPAIVVMLGTFPLSITPTIGLFGKKVYADGKIEGNLEFGAGGEVTCKLGGKLSFPNFFEPTGSILSTSTYKTPTWTTYKDFSMKTTLTPFKLTNFKAAANVNMHLQPKIILSIYAAIPINILPVFKADISLKTAARRLSSSYGSYKDSALRRLQATCTVGQTSYGAKGSVDMTIKSDAATAAKLVNGVFKSFATNPMGTATTAVIDLQNYNVLPEFKLATDENVLKSFDIVPVGCSDASGNAAPAVVQPSVSPSPSPSTGAIVKAGGGGDSKSATAALDGGAIAGIVIGSLALVGMIVFYYYLAFVAKGPIRCCCVVCLPVHPNPNANMDHSIQKIDPTTQHNPVLAIRNAASAATTAIHKATHHGPPPHSSHAHTPAPAPAEAAAPAPAPAPASAPPSKKGPPPKKGLSEAEIKAAAEEDAKKRAKKDFDADHLPPGWEWEEHDGEVFYTMPNGETTWDDPRHDWEIFWKEYLPKK